MSLQNAYQFHSVEAENVRAQYTEFDSVDFALDFENRAMVAGSVRINAEYRILNGGAELQGGERVYFDNNIGGHAFFSSINTSAQGGQGGGLGGLLENLVEYPRYVATKTAGSVSQADINTAKYICEARATDKKMGQPYAQMKTPVDVGGGAAGTSILQHNGSGQSAFANLRAAETVRPDFSIKPHCVLNNVAGGNSLLNYSTSGQIRMSVNLERNAVALYGEDVTGNITYELVNMRVTFASVPEPSKQMPIQLKAHLCLKSTINSSLANVSSKVPAIADGVIISFLTQAREVSTTFKNTELEKLPSVDKIRYSFNDSTSRLISYELKRIPDMIHEGIKAINKNDTRNLCRADLLAANKSFFIGLEFQETDLSKQKFNIQIENSQPINPLVMFAYYSSLITL